MCTDTTRSCIHTHFNDFKREGCVQREDTYLAVRLFPLESRPLFLISFTQFIRSHSIYPVPPPLLQYIRTRHALTSLWNLKQFIVTSQRHVNPLVTSSSTGTQDSKRLCQEICGNEKWRGFCSVRAEEIHLTSNPAGPRLVSSEMLAVPNTWDVPDVRSSVNTIHLKLGDEGAIN